MVCAQAHLSPLAGSSLVTALRSLGSPAWDQAPLRAKGSLRGSFPGLAYREELGVGKWGRG